MSPEKKKTSGTYKFKAEVSQLLDILTHSLYTHRDVYIRELISNAADALDKIRLKDVMGEKFVDPELELSIKIELDKENKTFTISDTGIGMTRDELVDNIGTIARSGTSEFMKMLAEEKKGDINLIGRFGVGFYSVFMAGEKVEVTSRSSDKKEPAFTWKSDGRGSFKLSPAEGDVKRGTTIKVFLREDAVEFSEEYTVKTAIEKYSNFVAFPIILGEEQVNKITAIWREPKSAVKKKEYNEFFKFIANQQDDAMTWMHFSADVPIQFHTLLFVPKSNLELFGFNKEDDGVNLFVKRVLIDAHATEILPPYLRFIRGVVESDDLPLNISRETLQENPHLFKIKSTIVSKFLSHLQNLAKKKPDEYKEFWTQHGRILKEGYNDYTNKDKIADLFLFNTSKCADADELVSLSTYVERMSDKQEEIIFLSGSSREALETHPNMEIFKAKDIEVIYCFDPIDEFVLPGLFTYKEKKIISADQVDLTKLSDIAVKDEDEKKIEKKPDEKELEKLTRRIKNILGDKVEDVKLSERLVDSPAVLVGSNAAMSSQMEKIMQMMNKEAKPITRVMEINGKHPIIKSMLKIYQENAKDAVLTKMVNGLFQSVSILDGQVTDPHAMASNIQDLITETAKLYKAKKKNS